MREVGRGPSELLPSLLPLSRISERPGQPCHGLPLTAPHHSLPLSLPESLSHPAPDTLLAGPVVVWIRSPGSFLFKMRVGGGKRRCWDLGAREGSLLAKAPGRPFFIFSPYPWVTSNHIFLLHALLTRSDSETSHRPPHTHCWQVAPLAWGEGSPGHRGNGCRPGVLERRCRPTPQGWGQGDGGAMAQARILVFPAYLCTLGSPPPPKTGHAPGCFVPGDP